MTEQPKIMNTSDVLRELRISQATLYRWLDTGFPRPFKLGPKKNAWFRADVEAWVARCAGIAA